MNSPSKNDLEGAQRRIAPYVHRTPILRCKSIDSWTGAEVLLKCENYQKVGAFKARGGVNAVQSLLEQGVVSAVATHSSGNHAQALALAAQIAGIKAFIVMPRTAPSVKKAAVLGYGAEVIECEPTLRARETTLDEVIARTGAEMIHPYNDYRVIAGQATAAMEIMEDYPDVNCIITPVGGGGLLSGTLLASKYFNPVVKVYAGEPEGADDAYRSLQEGKLIPSESPNTIADGLLTSLGDKTYPIIKEGVEQVVTVSDAEILDAMKMLWERAKLVVEPSGAVPLAALKKRQDLFAGQKVAVIISGGNVDVSKMIDAYFGK